MDLTCDSSRQARVQDVWAFFTPHWVAQNWQHLSPHLGRKRQFWDYCLSVWKKLGLIL